MTGPDPTVREPAFFAVTPTKLVVMSIFSFGLYQIYWFYKNWQLIAKHEGRSYALLARALLSVFFCYRLFVRVREAGVAAGARGYPAGWLATLYVVTSVFWLFPDAWLIIANAGVLCLLPVQSAANRVNAIDAPGHDRNGRFTVANFVVIFLGVALQAATMAYWKLMLSL
jgi:hypothetical protein